MKVGFYFDKRNAGNLDCTDILKGNPGVGGSEYEFLLVSYLLEKRNNDLDIVLFSASPIKVPHKNFIYTGTTIEGLCEACIREKVKTLVINKSQLDEKVFSEYSDKISLILWAHNTIPFHVLNQIQKISYVKRLVCCGREMLELFRDHPISIKSTYVYNIFPIEDKSWYQSRIDFSDNHNVVYMGMIAPVKGFHVLAQAWKDVLKRVPDAQLYVIGSGKLYDKDAMLGSHGLTSEVYEEQIFPYLEDENHNLLPSVHFMGLMGVEKYDVIGKCKVGVPNPTGDSETFCLCGIEMQLMNCGITTIYHPAYLDTVCNKNYLYKSINELAEYVSKRLLAPRDNYDKVFEFITKKFDAANSLSRWEEIIKGINEPLDIEPISDKKYHMKGLKDTLLRIKLKFPFFKVIPPIERVFNFWNHRILKR